MTSAVIKQLAIGPMQNFTYLVGCEASKKCAAVDPGWDAEAIAAAAEGLSWTIDKILLTHAHFDHANAAEELARLTGATVYLHGDEAEELPKGLKSSATKDGTEITVGGVVIRCMHTPGHTPGSQCFLVNNAILTGDTLFVDGCGRVDLPGSDPRKMLASLKALASLSPALVVYPGHDYGSAATSTIGEQLERNPYLSASSEAMLL